MITKEQWRDDISAREINMSMSDVELDKMAANEYGEIQLDAYQSAIDDALVAINGVPTTETTCLADRTLIVTALINLKNTIGGKL